jgi:hypothetical protein
VFPINSPDKYIILENNEPLIRGKYHLKHRRIDWKLIEGKQMKQSTLEMIVCQISGYQPPASPKVPMPQSNDVSRKKGRPEGPALKDWVKK